ncbi:MAG: pyridoxamine 5'-phosphate oxidase family protein [Bacteroidales bacterium]|nr:pyridoxamine 5'-phosphate oxidase family protein [Bacteroidales bacterium]MCF8392249.1 pyridoxamine 5'-phosphate oxidase family protein [Bacteroidales bacterium]
MSNQNISKDSVEEALRTNELGVLATEGDGQPHASLITVTPMDDCLHLIFATYRSTRKYKNLINNGKVSILFENRSIKSLSQPYITVVTAFGYAKEVDISASDLVRNAHVFRHPELESFLLEPDCAIFVVKVNAYQMVRGIDDINWWYIND